MPSAYVCNSQTRRSPKRELEFIEAYEVRVPHADRVLHADLTHEKAVHPAERKLHELDVL